MKKIVIKVSINCMICKSDVLQAVSKLQEIDGMVVNGEKGTLTVVGDVDPILVVKRLRKIGRVAEIVSVGPYKPPEPEVKERIVIVDLPSCCNRCELVGYKYEFFDQGGRCHIL